MAQKLRNHFETEARELGFDAVGVVRPQAIAAAPERLREFVEKGRHGSMAWMEETLQRRSKPRNLWPDVKSILVVSMNYGPETDPLVSLTEKENATISVYARNRDYHDVVKGKLKTLASKIVSRAHDFGERPQVKVFVDTAPVMEKPLAAAAGLGWQGKHTNLVSRDFGSWLFLGSIFTTLDLPPNIAEKDRCGSCSACLEICPTDAFPAPYKLDARRCISYLTIENKGPIPAQFRVAMGNRVFGCDDCLAVCPWNKFASKASENKLKTPQDARPSSLAHFLTLDDAAFRARFSGSPVKRIGHGRFVRNCLIAAGNSGSAVLLPLVAAKENDPDPVVAESARWAMNRLESGSGK